MTKFAKVLLFAGLLVIAGTAVPRGAIANDLRMSAPTGHHHHHHCRHHKCHHHRHHHKH